MSLLDITELSLSYGDKCLYKNAEFSLFKGEHVGIVGANGVGKSTFINSCTENTIPDEGQIRWQPGISRGYLDQHAAADAQQTVLEYMQASFSALFEKEKEMVQAYQRYSAGEEDALKKAEKYQQQLEAADFYSIEYRIMRIAEGLGLTAIGMDKQLGNLSGGQRAKVILSKLLLEEPDVLLLDEPTNFLDKEHIRWLSEYLTEFSGAFLVVSHDFAFLEQISTCICDIDEQSIRKYSGKYSDFLKQKKHLREDYIRRYTAQQKQIKKTEEYIRKNIAGVNSRNAKGRRKQLERLERMAPPAKTYVKPVFRFHSGREVHEEILLQVNGLAAGYYYPVISGISFTVNRGQMVVITGFNGIGKSTLLKTLVGQLQALDGNFSISEAVQTGYYEQEFSWDTPEQTPLAAIRSWFPQLTEKEARRHLAGCGIDSKKAGQSLSTLSGGEQAKVKLCRLTLQPANLLILDEPTNHLDDLAKEALKEALEKYEGTVILVSHEEKFYQDFADKIISLEQVRPRE